MKGFVPKREIGTEISEPLEQVFYVGQVVRCVVRSWQPDVRSLILSLKVCISVTMPTHSFVDVSRQICDVIKAPCSKPPDKGSDLIKKQVFVRCFCYG